MKATTIVKSIVLTEKSSEAIEAHNKYTFAVDKRANKIEIARAISDLFGVKVQSVNTANYSGKKKRQRTANAGKKADWKKAVVSLNDGETINFY